MNIFKSKWFAAFEIITTLIVVITAIIMINNRLPSYDNVTKSYANLVEDLRVRVSEKLMYEKYAWQAEQEGYNDLKRLFFAAADAQSMQIKNEYELLNAVMERSMPPGESVEVKSTMENLTIAANKEKEKAQAMYPEFIKISENEGFKKAKQIFSYGKQVSQANAELLLGYVSAGAPAANTEFYVCESCGKLSAGKRPDKCNICKKDRHKQY